MARTSVTIRMSLALAVMLFAGAVSYAAAPRVQAGVHYLPVDTAIKRYFDSGELSGAQLPALAQRAREAIELHPHYRYYDGLSFISYLQALDAADRPWLQRPALHRAMTAGLEAVRRAPAEPRTWLRIARTRAALEQPPADVASALKMSILTGRVEPTLLLPRLELGYAYLGVLDEETIALLRDQTVLGWRVTPRAFRRALDDGRLDAAQVRAVLGEGNEAILRDMEARS